MIYNRLCDPSVMGMHDRLMYNRWWLVKDNCWLVVDYGRTVHHHWWLMVNDRWSMKHNWCSMNHDIWSVVNLRWWVIDNRRTMDYYSVLTASFLVF